MTGKHVTSQTNPCREDVEARGGLDWPPCAGNLPALVAARNHNFPDRGHELRAVKLCKSLNQSPNLDLMVIITIS